MISQCFFLLSLIYSIVSAHGDSNHAKRELAERRKFLEIHTNNLNHCVSKHQAAGLDRRAVARRMNRIASVVGNSRKEARGTSPWDQSHKSDKPFNASTDPKEVFAGSNACVLSPETTEGPFYVTGESVRSSLIDNEAGIPLYLDLQVIDVNTCEPMPGIFLEIWNANSTGVYSGAISSVNGVNGLNDKSNLDKAFLRGAQMTDDDGAVQFITVFPGHYSGRATHLHVISHLNATAKANDTIWDTRVTHAGQVFFDQDLINEAEMLPPYSTNKQPMTKNSDDRILLQESVGADPFFNYVKLGDDLLQDGLFAWYSFGVNSSFTRDIMAVALKYAEGGQVATTNPKVPPFDQIFPGGFPTAWQPGFGPAPTGSSEDDV